MSDDPNKPDQTPEAEEPVSSGPEAEASAPEEPEATAPPADETPAADATTPSEADAPSPEDAAPAGTAAKGASTPEATADTPDRAVDNSISQEELDALTGSSGGPPASPAGASNLIDQSELDALAASVNDGVRSDENAGESAESSPAVAAVGAGEPAAVSDGASDAATGDLEAELEAEMAAAIAAEAAGSDGDPAAGGADRDPAILGSMFAPVEPEAAAPIDVPDLNSAEADASQTAIDLLDDVELDVKIELGRTQMYIEDVLRLGEGSVVELDKLAGDPVDIYVNERLVARGEVLVLNDNFCVRINDITSPSLEEDENKV